MPRKGLEHEMRMTPPPKGGPRAWGADCDHCPLAGRTPVFGDGPPQARLAVLGEAPGGNETDRGIPFIGRSGELLEAVLAKLGWHRTETWVDNAVACMPPGGDMKAFLRQAKRDLGDAYRSPVDCCRPRLFHALNVPMCTNCHRYVKGPENFRCTCEHSMPADQKRAPIESVAYVGNFALEALHGYQGISEKRGYVDWNGRPEQRPIAGQGHNGEKLDARDWLALYAAQPWTTTRLDETPAPSSVPQETSKTAKAPRSRSGSVSGRKSNGAQHVSSSSRPARSRGKPP